MARLIAMLGCLSAAGVFIAIGGTLLWLLEGKRTLGTWGLHTEEAGR